MIRKVIFLAAVGSLLPIKTSIARRSSIARRDQKSLTLGLAARVHPQNPKTRPTDVQLDARTRSPRSRSSIAAFIPEICQSLTARYSESASSASEDRLRPVDRAKASRRPSSLSATRIVKVVDDTATLLGAPSRLANNCILSHLQDRVEVEILPRRIFADPDRLVVGKMIRRNGKVVGRGNALEHPPGEIVFRAVAGAEEAARPVRRRVGRVWAAGRTAECSRGECRRRRSPESRA